MVSFNVNSVRRRLHQIERLVETHEPALIGLQETKVEDSLFPRQEFERYGYQVVAHGQKKYHGVALLTRLPLLRYATGLGLEPGGQKRAIYAELQRGDKKLRVINAYFPQGESDKHPTKYQDKKHFYTALTAYLQRDHRHDSDMVLMGDLNVAPDDIDVGVDHPERWINSGACSFLPEERAWLQELCAWGLSDSYRLCRPTAREFSWFDYRTRAFARSHKPGLRIDHILFSHSLLPWVEDAGIDYSIRAMDQPSDHAPVWAQLRDPKA